MAKKEIHIKDEFGERTKPQQSTERIALNNLKMGKITFNQYLTKIEPGEKQKFEKLEQLKKEGYVKEIYIKYNDSEKAEFYGSLTPAGKGKFSKNYYAMLGGTRTYNEDILGLAEGQTESPYKELTDNKRFGNMSVFETQTYVLKESNGEYGVEGIGLTKAKDYLKGVFSKN